MLIIVYEMSFKNGTKVQQFTPSHQEGIFKILNQIP